MTSKIWDVMSRRVFGVGGSNKSGTSTSSTAAETGPTSTTTSSSALPEPSSSAAPGSERKSDTSSSSNSFLSSPYFDSSSYWKYANDSVNYATESTYLTVASVLSPLYADSSTFFGSSHPQSSSASSLSSGSDNTPSLQRRSSFLLRMAADRRLASPTTSSPSRKTTTTSTPDRHPPHLLLPSGGVAWNTLTRNPYNVVRGRQPVHHRRQSISAVRSFLALVPLEEEEEDEADDWPNEDAYPQHVDQSASPSATASSGMMPATTTTTTASPVPSPAAAGDATRSRSRSFADAATSGSSSGAVMAALPTGKDEKASQVAEGTLRALRDLALEEALELNVALRFWSNRWERPLLCWLEAGPLGKVIARVGSTSYLPRVMCLCENSYTSSFSLCKTRANIL